MHCGGVASQLEETAELHQISELTVSINNTTANRLKYHRQEEGWNRAVPQSLGWDSDTTQDILKETRDAVGIENASHVHWINTMSKHGAEGGYP